ncbi:hypothetical protein JCM5296_006652 [Sporobolomyces johnsonii]
MSSPTASAAPNGQEGLQVLPQPSPAATATAASANSDGRSVTSIVSDWKRASESERAKVLQVIEEYYRAARFEAGTSFRTMSRAIYTNPSATYPTSLLVLAARTLRFRKRKRTVPADTIRFTIPAPSAASKGASRRHLYSVRDNLVAHYNDSASLPPVPDMDISDEASCEDLGGVVSGTRVHAFNPGRNGSTPSHELDVAFRSLAAFAEALVNPFSFDGKVVKASFVLPPSLAGVVELRMELRDLNTSDAAIVQGLTDALRLTPTATVLKVLRLYDMTRSAKRPAVPVFGGRISAFVRLDLVSDDAGANHHHLATVLPSSVSIDGDMLPTRHNYETAFCRRCRFAGHDASSCPKYPCSACNKAGHTSATCTDPRREMARGAVLCRERPGSHRAKAGW